ncbi:MAG: hypothetical protein ACYC26_11385 [Phycisphaerales bacterium]
MGTFAQLCRNLGLMIHNVKHPGREHKVVRKEVHEEKRGDITLRRTTIEEIEIRNHDKTSQ